MSLNASNIQSTVDPALLPIQTNELKPLVRLLHILSEKINKKVKVSEVYSLQNSDRLL